jgi:hypothetical protein
VSNVEEDRFEAYLKTFQPLRTDPLPEVQAGGATIRFPFAWAAAAALGGLMLLAGIHDWKVTSGAAPPEIALAPRATRSSPLTLSGINSLLTKADSLKAGLDEVTWKSRRVQVRPGQQSALAVLGRENL